jgi:micrococcal nuclease
VRNKFQTLVGYLIVLGIIAITVAVILYVQRKPTGPGKYAELIKENTPYHVEKMLDGDTLVANIEGHEVTVRLIGMDTPEVVDPRKPVQCYGPEASAKGKELLNGKDVTLEREKDREPYDKYGRVLAYARMSDGTLYNEYMIEKGYAHEYTFSHEKYKYQKEFKAAEVLAKKNKMGLWASCTN